MIDDPVLLGDWHVVARSPELRAGEVPGARLLGLDLVLFLGGCHFYNQRVPSPTN